MNKSFQSLILILVVFSIGYFGNRLLQSHLGENAVSSLEFPVNSMEQGLILASEQGKPILADYSAIWCPACRRLDEEVFADPLVSATIKENFVYVRMEFDGEEGLAFAKKFDLQGFPRILVLNSQGEKIEELPLLFEPSQYNSNLTMVLNSI